MKTVEIHIHEKEGPKEDPKGAPKGEPKGEQKHELSKPTREGKVVGPKAIGREVLVERIADGETYIARFLGETKTGLGRVIPIDPDDCGGTIPFRPRAVSMHAIDKVF